MKNIIFVYLLALVAALSMPADALEYIRVEGSIIQLSEEVTGQPNQLPGLILRPTSIPQHPDIPESVRQQMLSGEDMLLFSTGQPNELIQKCDDGSFWVLSDSFGPRARDNQYAVNLGMVGGEDVIATRMEPNHVIECRDQTAEQGTGHANLTDEQLQAMDCNALGFTYTNFLNGTLSTNATEAQYSSDNLQPIHRVIQRKACGQVNIAAIESSPGVVANYEFRGIGGQPAVGTAAQFGAAGRTN